MQVSKDPGLSSEGIWQDLSLVICEWLPKVSNFSILFEFALYCVNSLDLSTTTQRSCPAPITAKLLEFIVSEQPALHPALHNCLQIPLWYCTSHMILGKMCFLIHASARHVPFLDDSCTQVWSLCNITLKRSSRLPWSFMQTSWNA